MRDYFFIKPSSLNLVAPKREYKFGKNYVSHYKKSGVAYQPKRKQQKRPIKGNQISLKILFSIFVCHWSDQDRSSGFLDANWATITSMRYKGLIC